MRSAVSRSDKPSCFTNCSATRCERGREAIAGLLQQLLGQLGVTGQSHQIGKDRRRDGIVDLGERTRLTVRVSRHRVVCAALASHRILGSGAANPEIPTVGSLYSSCLQAEGVVQYSTLINPWVPEADSCAADIDAFARGVAAQADQCRQRAVVFDAADVARVHRGLVRTCMAQAGFARMGPRQVKKWLRGCNEAPEALLSRGVLFDGEELAFYADEAEVGRNEPMSEVQLDALGDCDPKPVAQLRTCDTGSACDCPVP